MPASDSAPTNGTSGACGWLQQLLGWRLAYPQERLIQLEHQLSRLTLSFRCVLDPSLSHACMRRVAGSTVPSLFCIADWLSARMLNRPCWHASFQLPPAGKSLFRHLNESGLLPPLAPKHLAWLGPRRGGYSMPIVGGSGPAWQVRLWRALSTAPPPPCTASRAWLLTGQLPLHVAAYGSTWAHEPANNGVARCNYVAPTRRLVETLRAPLLEALSFRFS